MSFGLQFNATQVAPNIAPDPVPSGQYVVKIVASEEKPTSGKPGCTYYMFTFEIQEGEYKGRRVFTNLNCKHDQEQTRNIAYATLSSICYVTGVLQVNNSQELHDRPFRINVTKEPRNDKPEIMRNNVTGYYNLDGSEPGKTKATAPTNGAPAFATGASTIPSSGFGAPAPNGSFPATAPTLTPITTPTPEVVQQPQPTLQPIVSPTQPALQPIAAPVTQPEQITQAAQQPTVIMQRPDGTLVNQHGQPVDQYGQPLPLNSGATPAPYQPTVQPAQSAQPAQQQSAPQNGAPPVTPPWAS